MTISPGCKSLCDRYEPESFSEHLAWSSHGDVFLNDLLPLPYTAETLARVVAHIDKVQDLLERQMLLENPATYLPFTESTIEETDFLAELVAPDRLRPAARRQQCLRRRHQSRLSTRAPISPTSPSTPCGEIHLAAIRQTDDDAGAALLIDATTRRSRTRSGSLSAEVLERTGPVARPDRVGQ